MRISDWSSDVCSSDLEPGRELHEPPGGALRLVLEVALSLLERGSWTLPSWHVEQALAARAARELGWTVAPIRPPESGELGLRLQNKLSSKVLQNILIPSPLEGEAERDQVLRTLCDLADGGSPGERPFLLEVATVFPLTRSEGRRVGKEC